MKKVFLIGWKDLTLAFRDRAALILMLLAPFALTIGLGFVTGGIGGSSSSGVSNIPVILVNQDGDQLGNSLVEAFQSKDLSTLISASTSTDAAAAQRQVDADQTAAVIIIPAGFTRSIIPAAGASAGPLVKLELYANPSRPTSVGVVKTIIEEFVSRVEVGRVAGQVVVNELVSQGLIQAQDAGPVGSTIGVQLAKANGENAAIRLKTTSSGGAEIPFNVLAYMAPGMALLFLMYTTSQGGRSLLAERAQGTLPRLLVTPTRSSQVLGGKIFGVFLTGVAQMLILILSSTLLFNLKWGDPLGVLALIMAAVAGAVGWGMLITSLAKTPGQVSTAGSAIMLTFGILGGSFINVESMPKFFQVISKITPNAWGLDGFTTLALGGKLGDILLPVTALLIMGALLFSAGVFIMNRRGSLQP